MARFSHILGALVICLTSVGLAAGPWQDQSREYRRVVMLAGEEAKVTGQELAGVRFLCNGKQKPDGSDIAVYTPAGKLVPSRVIWTGPGDWAEVVFNTQKLVREYDFYFGGGKPYTQQAEMNRGGLTLEIRPLSGPSPTTEKDLQATFDAAGKAVGRKMISRPFVGANPFGITYATISRASGRIFAPMDGNYTFAAAAHEKGALFIDGKPVVMAHWWTGEARFQGQVKLDRGWHEFAFYHASHGEYAFSVGWKRPDMGNFEPVGREAFGLVAGTAAQPLEGRGKPRTADLQVSYQGEAFFGWNYSHRLKFEAASLMRLTNQIQAQWNFGDGQTATGRSIEHVYITPGTYDVTVTVTAVGLSDTQTFRVPVDRDWERANQPPTDEVSVHSGIVASYNPAKLSPEDCSWAVLMHLRGKNFDAALAAAKATAEAKSHGNRNATVKAFDELADEAVKRNQLDALLQVYRAIPQESDLNPAAAVEHANLLMYRTADFPGAIKAIEPFAQRDNAAKRCYGQALVLAGRLDEARKLLEALPVAAAKYKAPAISGAMARTTEFYIQEKDTVNGEEAWEKWMNAFPAEFLEGNSVLLRVKLMQLRNQDAVAAKVAEAYANANPQSAYASRLLSTASQLLEKADPTKSAALKQLLKQRYPEDPLSQ